MLKVVTFMKQVATGLQVEGNFGTAHVYRSSLNAIIAYCGKADFTFEEVSPEWLKGFEIHLRSRGCSWNTVSTYLRTFRAVYNRAVDLGKAPYVPHLFRSVYTGTRTDHKRALCDEDMKKVFAKLSRTSGVPFAVCQAQELFILMFSLRGMPFVDLAYFWCMILIVIILSAFFACIIAANSYLFQNALLWKMASCFVGLWILCMIITVFVCRKLECSN